MTIHISALAVKREEALRSIEPLQARLRRSRMALQSPLPLAATTAPGARALAAGRALDIGRVALAVDTARKPGSVAAAGGQPAPFTLIPVVAAVAPTAPAAGAAAVVVAVPAGARAHMVVVVRGAARRDQARSIDNVAAVIEDVLVGWLPSVWGDQGGASAQEHQDAKELPSGDGLLE